MSDWKEKLKNHPMRDGAAGVIAALERELAGLRELREAEACGKRVETDMEKMLNEKDAEVARLRAELKQEQTHSELRHNERDEAREAARAVWDGGISSTEALDRWPWLEDNDEA